MGMVHYTEADVGYALAALMASAKVDPDTDEIQPCFAPVSRKLGISRTTLKRWWDARPMDTDVHLQSAGAHARAAAVEAGARDWLSSVYQSAQKGVEYITDESRVREGHRIGDLSRALETAVRLARKLDDELSPRDGEQVSVAAMDAAADPDSVSDPGESEMQALARRVLYDLVRNPDTSDAVRLRAALALLPKDEGEGTAASDDEVLQAWLSSGDETAWTSEVAEAR